MSSLPPTPDAPPKSALADLWRVVALLAVAAAVHWWLVAHTSITARDSIGLARYAFALDDSKRTKVDVLREEAHPPGYPLAIVAADKLVGANPNGPDFDKILLAAQIASSVAGVLIVLPMYWLGRRLFDRSAGFWAALLFQFLPVFARDSADGLTDGPFLLCALSAVACGAWALDRQRVLPGLLACGLLSGLAYLIRPEGVLVPLAAVAVMLLRVRELAFGRMVLGIMVVAIGFLAVGGPYMAVIGGFTNKKALTKLGAEPEMAAARGPLFAESIPDQRPLGVLFVTGKEWLKAGHYGVAVAAIIGLVMCFGRVRRETKFWLPVFYAGGQLAVVTAVGLNKWYVSERHLLPVTAVGVLFAVGGLSAWFKLWTKVPGVGRVFEWRWWPTVTCLAFVVAGAVPILNTRLHEDRLGHKLAGAELAKAIDALPPEQQAGVVVIDHYQWCQFFSGRAIRAIPPDPEPANQRVVFVVLERKEKDENGQKRWVLETPDFDSPRHKQAVSYFQQYSGTPAMEVLWPKPDPNGPPQHSPPDGAKIVLAKITLPPK